MRYASFSGSTVVGRDGGQAVDGGGTPVHAEQPGPAPDGNGYQEPARGHGPGGQLASPGDDRGA